MGLSLALWTLAFAFDCHNRHSRELARRTLEHSYRRVPYTNRYDMVFGRLLEDQSHYYY